MDESKTGTTHPHEFRGRIYDNIVDTIGATPLVRLSRLMKDESVEGVILGKCEYFNPLASVKDRIGLAMIEAAERDGRIEEGATLVEPTSGNTGRRKAASHRELKTMRSSTDPRPSGATRVALPPPIPCGCAKLSRNLTLGPRGGRSKLIRTSADIWALWRTRSTPETKAVSGIFRSPK